MDLLDQALAHPSRAMFQGRSMLLVRADSDCPAAVWSIRGFIKRRCLEPLPGRSSAAWRAGFRLWIRMLFLNTPGTSSAPTTAVRRLICCGLPCELTPDQMDAFVAADPQMYQAWLQLESAWVPAGDASDATV